MKAKAFLLMVCIALIAVVYMSCNQDQYNGEVYYSLTRDSLQKVLDSSKGKLTAIPNKIDGVPVVSLGREMFYEVTDLIEIELPPNLVAIGDSCFRECMSLSHIELPQSLKIIGRDAFRDCQSLRTVTIPFGVEVISEGAFMSCYDL